MTLLIRPHGYRFDEDNNLLFWHCCYTEPFLLLNHTSGYHI